MSLLRSLLTDFSLANPIYAGATVSIFSVNPSTLDRSNTLVAVYDNMAGLDTLPNPQVLDAEGKWVVPPYVDQAVVMVIGNSRVPPHETGVIAPRGQFCGAWAAGLGFFPGDVVGAPDGSLFICAAPHVSGLSFGNDIIAGLWQLFLNAQAIVAAVVAQITPEVLNAAAVTSVLLGAPTTAPVQPNQLWRNGPFLAVS